MSIPEPRSVVHRAPHGCASSVPCCGEQVFDLPRTDRMTTTETVTCPGPTEPMEIDTLPQWLAHRFSKTDWDELDDDTRLWWQHEAAAVRRAVARGGFKQPLATGGAL